MKIKCHIGMVYTITELNNKQIATGAFADNTIYLWGMDNGHKVGALYDIIGLNNKKGLIGTKCMQTLTNGILAAGYLDGSIRLWDLNTGIVNYTLKEQTGPIFGFTTVSDFLFASASLDNTIHIRNTENGEKVHVLECSGPILSIIQLKNGDIAAGLADNTIQIWHPQSGELVSIINAHTRPVYSLLELNNGKLASGSQDHKIKIWDLNNYQLNNEIQFTSTILHLLHINDHRVAVGTGDNSIIIWEGNFDYHANTFEGHRGPIQSMTILSDGRLASGYNDGTVYIIDI